jgi:hypothetical protein
MADLEYTEKKLRWAVEALATSAAPIQQRLLTAALAMDMLTPDDLEDKDDRSDLSALQDMLKWTPDDVNQSLLRAAIGQMSDEQAVAAANSIFTLYARLTLKR